MKPSKTPMLPFIIAKSNSLYKTATTPAIAMTAAAKLPTCLASAAALPVAEAPVPAELDPLAVTETLFEPVAVATPVETTAPVVADVTIVVVQLQSELYTAVV